MIVFVILVGEEKLVMSAVPIVNAPIKKSMLASSQMSATVKSILPTRKAYVPPNWNQQVNYWFSSIICTIMAISVVEFSREGFKIRKVL